MTDKTGASGTSTQLDLDAIRAREAAATPGPWVAVNTLDEDSEWASEFDDPMVVTEDSTPGIYTAIAKDICQGATDGVADAEFIAHARQDVADLLAEVDALRDALDEAHCEASTLSQDLAEMTRTAFANQAQIGGQA
jgi:hypothetical protein